MGCTTRHQIILVAAILFVAVVTGVTVWLVTRQGASDSPKNSTISISDTKELQDETTTSTTTTTSVPTVLTRYSVENILDCVGQTRSSLDVPSGFGAGMMDKLEEKQVACDTAGYDTAWGPDGPWVVLQRRSIGDTEFFHKTWDEYAEGFGNLTGDHWLGLDYLHSICHRAHPCTARFDFGYDGEVNPIIPKQEGTYYYEVYRRFYVENKQNKFKLHVGGPYGTAGNTIAGSATRNNFDTRSDGAYFSTYDNDNDDWPKCCVCDYGPWWHHKCSIATLNSRWGWKSWNGIKWWTLTGPDTNNRDRVLNWTQIKVKRHDCNGTCILS